MRRNFDRFQYFDFATVSLDNENVCKKIGAPLFS